MTDDKTIQRYHQQYLGSPKITNVIAFSPNSLEGSVLGDVVISVETAQREAESVGVQLEERIVYLMIHAILHLLGYDHDRPGARTLKMRRMEKKLFQRVGGSSKALEAF